MGLDEEGECGLEGNKGGVDYRDHSSEYPKPFGRSSRKEQP
jgi:hypothetical protein